MIQQIDAPKSKQMDAQAGTPDTQHDPSVQTMSKRQPRDLVRAYAQGWRGERATEKQKDTLKHTRFWRDDMTRGEAFDWIAAMCDKDRRTTTEKYVNMRYPGSAVKNKSMEEGGAADPTNEGRTEQQTP